jgi:hypothetical protein
LVSSCCRVDTGRDAISAAMACSRRQHKHTGV